MRSPLALAAWGLLTISTGTVSAFEVDAVIKRVDAENRVVVFHAVQMDRTAKVAEDASLVDEKGEKLADGLKAKGLKEGAEVRLTIERVDNKPLIRAIVLGKKRAPAAAAPAQPQAADVAAVDTSKLVAITDLGTGQYQGFPGGLYPDGKNSRPSRHEAAGRALAEAIKPLDADGKPSADGKIVLLGIGFSNTVQAFSGFMRVAQNDAEINPAVVLVNGAVGGMSAEMVQHPDQGRGAQYWAAVDDRLKAAGVTRAQVQAVWIKETNPAPHPGGFPKYVQDLQAQLVKIVRIVHERFPNAKLAYLSSRTYGGWAKRRPNGNPPGNSEPFSYESGFAVKWLIEQQLKAEPALNFDPATGPVESPWLSWGPYLWANGSTPRSDGFSFMLSDFMATDQMHESPTGQLKIGGLLLRFFKTDPTTRVWFLRAGAPSRSGRSPGQ